uniref:Uncharacterized protein n=1 Tax=Ornithorhynchus anatinus TaxID=9258 RepID=A0A6I8N1G9_ORNAN
MKVFILACLVAAAVAVPVSTEFDKLLVKDLPTIFSSEWEQFLRHPEVYVPLEVPVNKFVERHPFRNILFPEELPEAYQPIEKEDSSSSSEETVQVPVEKHLLRLRKLHVPQKLRPLRFYPNHQVPFQRHPLPYAGLQVHQPVEVPFPLPVSS